MKLIDPVVDYWPQGEGIDGVWEQIAKATRVSCQSKAREGESPYAFVKRVIFKPALVEGDLDSLKSCVFNFDKMHGSCLEHGTIYLLIPYRSICTSDPEKYIDNPFSYCSIVSKRDGEKEFAITTNMRVILENRWLDDLQYLCEPTEYHDRRYTFAVTTDIGVSREMNRNRAFSITEESTRYCAYNSGKFGSEITYVKPAWVANFFANKFRGHNMGEWHELFKRMCNSISEGAEGAWNDRAYMYFGLLASEFAYIGLKHKGVVNDQCRQVLNLSTKTQVVYTAFKRDWDHFVKLRADNVSGVAHPNIQLIANEIKKIINVLDNHYRHLDIDSQV